MICEELSQGTWEEIPMRVEVRVKDDKLLKLYGFFFWFISIDGIA